MTTVSLKLTTVSLKLTEDRVKHLHKMSHFLSLERDSNLSLSDIIREALDNSYPMPENETEED